MPSTCLPQRCPTGVFTAKKLSAALLKRISQINSKRPKAVLDHIVAHGSVSTDQLKAIGYNHVPRAARDVRELGIRLITTSVKNSAGGRMASYTFADPPLEAGKQGRTQFPKKLRIELIDKAGGRCAVCRIQYNLQIDHKIPYEIAAESQAGDHDPYQVLCGSCNRTKSWACEHCENMLLKNPNVRRGCYWVDRTDYQRVAMRRERRVDVVWTGDEVQSFETFRIKVTSNGRTPAEELKALLSERITLSDP